MNTSKIHENLRKKYEYIEKNRLKTSSKLAQKNLKTGSKQGENKLKTLFTYWLKRCMPYSCTRLVVHQFCQSVAPRQGCFWLLLASSYLKRQGREVLQILINKPVFQSKNSSIILSVHWSMTSSVNERANPSVLVFSQWLYIQNRNIFWK